MIVTRPSTLAGTGPSRRAAGDQAIRKEDADKRCLVDLSYHEHLWMEREIKSVANVTHHDIREFFALAAEIPIRAETTTYRLEEANQALLELKRGGVRGAKVLLVG